MTVSSKQQKYISLIRVAVILLVALMQNNCAQESTPQGGAQDKDAPKVKRISPADKSLFFRGNKIEIKFNEFIKETGFAQTLISPPTAKRPDFNVEGRTLTIKLKSALRDSTTYTINFGDDVKDLNEGNIAENFTYVFSTGSYIDSQKISGTVITAKDNTPAEGIIVSLYPKDSANAILKSKPFYFSKTDKAGSFKIENIKAGKYWIYALKDQNYNYIYDQPNELIAFSDTIIDLSDSISPNVKLFLFDENKRKLQLDEVRSLSPGQLQISYTKPIKNFKLDWEGYTENDFAYVYPTNDTINYWFSNYYQQKDSFYLTANDTLLDTVRMEMKFIKKDSLNTGNKNALSIVNQVSKSRIDSSNKANLILQELNKPLKINFSRPIIKINEAKQIQIKEDTESKMIEPKFTVDEKTKMYVEANFEKKENTKYVVEIPDSALQDIFGTWNKKLTYQFTSNSKTSYGNLHITLKTEHPENYYTIHLLNSANEVVKEFFFTGNGERKVSADNILAGAYKFEVIDDTNKNGVWDTGDFKQKIQPEKIYTYKDIYQLKGGWDLDVEVKF